MNHPTLPGLDAVLEGHQPQIASFLRSKKLGLLTNQTGQTRENTPANEAFQKAGFNVLALFSPEHGPQGVLEGEIASSKLEDGTPIYSLYGQTRRPTPEMLHGLDAVVCDLQDVGARFYTYGATIFEMMEACAPLGIALVILDRPNPLGGLAIEGPIIETDLMSFIGPAPLPVTHGMSLGELAFFYRDWKKLNLEIEIARVQNWNRAMTWSETGLQWRRPSPNLPDFISAAWYPGLCLLEFSDLSVGRSTDAPFQILGAPDFDAEKFIAHFNSSEEIRAEAVEFTPTHAVFAGEKCRGVRFSSANLPQRPVEFGLRVMHALRQSHPDFSRASWDKADKLLGSRAVLDSIWNGDLEFALEKSRVYGEVFAEKRAEFLIY
ncbi:MAG TPA: DUF1343 domain-containing protein [Abditibacterium sp.]|jgi:uncharacterized protein YbbC (DUF1343 family)